ncbi:hypothetical protein ISCGN_023961 [Ixodes scapularis]
MPISCRFYSQKYPEPDDVVMVNVRQIAEMGAYVRLLEYNDIEGMILLSELSRRRIRSINKLIRVGRNECVVVIRVDKDKVSGVQSAPQRHMLFVGRCTTRLLYPFVRGTSEDFHLERWGDKRTNLKITRECMSCTGRNDIAMAITKYDQFDFLIDIVPRDELKPAAKRTDDTVRTTVMPPDQVQYYFQLAQQHREALQQQQQPTTLTAAQAQQPQQIQIVQTTGANPQTLTVQNVQNAAQAFSMPSVLQVQQVGAASAEQQQQNAQQQQIQLQVQAQPQVVQLQQPVQQQVAQQGGIQIVQQIINSNGEIQQIPIQLTQAQLQLIRMQMQGQSSGQPIIIQTAPIQQAAPPPQPVQQTQTLYQIQQGPGQPASVFLAPAGSMTAAGQTAVQIQTQQDGQQSEDDGTDQ